MKRSRYTPEQIVFDPRHSVATGRSLIHCTVMSSL